MELVRTHGKVPDSFKLSFAVCGKTKNTQSSIKLANPKFAHQCFQKCLKWYSDFSPDVLFASDDPDVYEWAPMDPKLDCVTIKLIMYSLSYLYRMMGSTCCE